MALLSILCVAGLSLASPEVALKCVSGEVRWGPESGEVTQTLTPSAGEVVASEPFRFAADAGTKLEVTKGDFALRLTGPFEGTFRPSEERPTISLGKVASFALSLGEMSAWVGIGPQYAFEGEQVLVEGTLADDGEIRLTNRAGLPISLYRNGRQVDFLPEGMRARMGAPSPATPPPAAPSPSTESAAQTMRWGGRTIEVPAGVFSTVEGGRLFLEGRQDLSGAAVVRLDGEAFVVRAGGILEIDADGKVVSLEGPARRVVGPGAGRRGDPFLRSETVTPTSTGVVFVSPSVP
jgi:hypothetical protein